MKKLAILFLATFYMGSVNAQILSPDIISNGGGVLSNTDVVITYTIGEPVTGKVSTSTAVCSQGFQQNWNNEISAHESPDAISGINVYPNPSKDIIIISWQANHSEEYLIELFDLNGKNSLTENLPNSITEKQINLSNYAEGIYLLKIKNITNGKTETFKIQKVN